MNARRMEAEETGIGLVAWLEATRVRLPLRAVDCGFSVFGDIADVRVDQVFVQDNPVAVDVTYTFPLPGDAAVYALEMIVGGRVIRAVVKEEGEAREMAAILKAEGRRVARTEAPRENLFQLELGNAQPGDVIVIRLRYFQILDRVGDLLSLSIPTCPGIRYIPGRPLLRANRGRGVCDDTDAVPDASRITPPRIGDLHPDAAGLIVEGTLAAEGADLDSISSPSHKVVVARRGEGLTVGLARAGSYPDRDFVLRWRERAEETAVRALCRREGGRSYAAVRVAAPPASADAARAPVDAYLLVDRSGSMGGIKWAKAVEALGRFAGELGEGDRIFLTLFDTRRIDFDDRPVAPREMIDDPGFGRIGTDEGPRGGTALLPALKHVIGKMAEHSAGRRSVLVLITDGQVGDERRIVRAMGRFPGEALHCVGIDTAVNDAFLKRLSREHRGGCLLLTPNDNIARAVAALAVRLRQPALLGLGAGAGWEPARRDRVGGVDVYPGEAVTLVFRGSGRARRLRIAGRRGDGTPVEFTFPVEGDGSQAPRLLWVKGRISELLARGSREEAVALAVEHNVACEGASFLAWDEAEQVLVARRDICQPSLFPGEWDAPTRMMLQSPASDGDATRRACYSMLPMLPDPDVRCFMRSEAAPRRLKGRVQKQPKKCAMRSSAARVAKSPGRAMTDAPRRRDPWIRYRSMASWGFRFPEGAAWSIRTKMRVESLCDRVKRASADAPEEMAEVIVGIVMVWLAGGGGDGIAARLARVESVLEGVSERESIPLIEALAGILSDPERKALLGVKRALARAARSGLREGGERQASPASSHPAR